MLQRTQSEHCTDIPQVPHLEVTVLVEVMYVLHHSVVVGVVTLRHMQGVSR